MQNKIITNLKYLDCDKNSHLLLAVSGGIDSMVMLHFFQQNKKQFKFSVAHINHNYHSESKKMENLLKAECVNKNNLITRNIDANEINSNIESEFRKIRYNELERIREEVKADFIVTAHHADDQAETVMMKILNSSGFDGLQGIRKKNHNVIRPMHNISKDEINNYSSKHCVEFIDDPTNLDITFTRNFLRKNIFNELKKLKKDIHLPFINFNERIDEVHDLISFNVQNFCNSVNYSVKEDFVEIDKSEFFNLPFLVQLRIISNICLSNKTLTKTDIRELKDFFRKNNTGSTRKIFESTIHIDRNSIFIYKSLDKEFYKKVDAGVEMKEDHFTFSWNFEEYPKNFSSSTQVEYIDGSKLKNNLVIRSVRDDDSFLPLGMKGNKKVMKFLKDKKLSLINRKQSLVICNDDEIIWVAGHQLSEKYKIKENSVKIVKLNFFRN